MPRANARFWTATAVFLALVLSKFSPEFGFTALIRFGESWQDRRLSAIQTESIATVRDSNGYDGQFYAQIAVDPSLKNPELDRALDAPAYRARRILAPLAAYLSGLGDTKWVLEAYALLNVVCWIATAWWLARLVDLNTAIGLARWIGCMFGMGVLDSVRQSLVDLPALMFLTMACSLKESPAASRSSMLLSLGNLTKETNVLGTIALYLDPKALAQWKRSILLLLLATLPLAGWTLYVQHRFQSSPGPEGLGNFTWPVLGLVRHIAECVSQLTQGNFDGRFSFGLLAALGLGLQAWTLWRNRQLNSPWWRIGVAYSVLLLVLGPWVWSGYWAAQRAVLPMTVAFNLILPANRAFWPTWALANLTIAHAIWRFL